jgi:hypothetical protein
VIHGHGEGILKKHLRELLKKNDDLAFESESGDGVSRIFLR